MMINDRIIIGVNHHDLKVMPKIASIDVGESDAYTNYWKGHYSEEYVQHISELDPNFYLMENLTIYGGGSSDCNDLNFFDDIPILFAHCNDNYLHFLFENIGRILFLKEKNIKFKPIIAIPIENEKAIPYFSIHKFLDNPFKKIGIDTKEVFMPYHKYNKIYFLKSINTTIDTLLHLESYSITSKLLRKYLREPGVPMDNIYISRRYSLNNNPRFINNEEKIEKYYYDLGYKIVYNENLTFTEQIELYKNAKHIVGISGTGLVNILFAPDDCKLTELRTSNYRDDEVFKYICKYVGNDYELITSYNSNGNADIVLNDIKSTATQT